MKYITISYLIEQSKIEKDYFYFFVSWMIEVIEIETKNK